jgi:hypothetical protein
MPTGVKGANVDMWISYPQPMWKTFNAYPPPLKNVENLSTAIVDKYELCLI